MPRKKHQPVQAARKVSESLVAATDEFLHNPPDVCDYKSFNKFYNALAKCVLRAESDETFKFNTKTATALTYMGTVLLLGIDRQTKEGGVGLALEQQFKELQASGSLQLTTEQAMLLLKQQESGMAMKLMIKFAAENGTPIEEQPTIDVTPVETVTPVGRRIAALQTRVSRKQQEENQDDYAF